MARQYSGTLGKVGNSQIAVSLHAASDAASCPLNWRLFVPESWDDLCAETNEQAEAIAARRTKVGIPDTIRHRTKWELALEMIDELAAWDHKPPVLVGDAGYGNATAFRRGLTEREIPYVLAVQATTTAHPGDAVPTTPSRRRRPAPDQDAPACRGTGTSPNHYATSRSAPGDPNCATSPGAPAPKHARTTPERS